MPKINLRTSRKRSHVEHVLETAGGNDEHVMQSIEEDVEDLGQRAASNAVQYGIQGQMMMSNEQPAPTSRKRQQLVQQGESKIDTAIEQFKESFSLSASGLLPKTKTFFSISELENAIKYDELEEKDFRTAMSIYLDDLESLEEKIWVLQRNRERQSRDPLIASDRKELNPDQIHIESEMRWMHDQYLAVIVKTELEREGQWLKFMRGIQGLSYSEIQGLLELRRIESGMPYHEPPPVENNFNWYGNPTVRDDGCLYCTDDDCKGDC